MMSSVNFYSMLSCVLYFVVHEGDEEGNASIAHSKLGLRGECFQFVASFLRKEIYSTILVKEKREETFSCLRLSKGKFPL